MSKDFNKQLDKAIKVASKHQLELMKHPGVVAVGVGPKREKGKITTQAAIVITVRKKLSADELKKRGEKKLPATLESLPVDVVEYGMPLEAKKIRDAQQKAQSVIKDIQKEWLKKENITCIGYGYKIKDNKTDFNIIAIKFFVKEKLPQKELKKRKIVPIPQQLKGIVTDVIQVSQIKPLASSGSRGDRHDPLAGGISVGVGSRPFHYGTYGATVFDQSTGEQLVLSNQHVLDATAGTDTIQPSPVGLDDSLEVGFQLDICNPLHFIRLDTPNTTLGTVLAGGAVAAAIAAALSDVIDPTRRGQKATPPPPSAKTKEEHHSIHISYPEFPLAGTPYAIKTNWKYNRVTDSGVQSHHVEETNHNPHILSDKLLITNKKSYHPGEVIELYGFILPKACDPNTPSGEALTDDEIKTMTHFERQTTVNFDIAAMHSEKLKTSPPSSTTTNAVAPPNHCHCEYHPVAILTPTTVDKAFPVVLKALLAQEKNTILKTLLAHFNEQGDEALLKRFYHFARYGCLYKGKLTVTNIPLGPWKHYFYVQTVNNTKEGLNPLIAAQIIGGLPVSQNAKADLDVACGPLIIEDGEFDIELI